MIFVWILLGVTVLSILMAMVILFDEADLFSPCDWIWGAITLGVRWPVFILFLICGGLHWLIAGTSTKCPNRHCGFENLSGAAYCARCGHKLGSDQDK